MTLVETIIKLTKLIYTNYFSKGEEKSEFLKILFTNLEYDNGYLKIHEEHVNDNNNIETDYPYTDLKELVQSWSRDKVEKKDYWNNLLDERVCYVNGGLYLGDENTDFIKQDMYGFCTYETQYQGKALYYIESRLTPTVNGQRIQVLPEYSVYQTYVDDNSRLALTILSDTVLESITLVALPYNDHGTVYSGGSVTVTVEN